MPTAAPRKCTQVGCRAMAVNGGRCEAHQREQWLKKPQQVKRITGRRLQRMRAELFMREPLCRCCKELGIVTLATQRDHIKPLFEGGTDDDGNIQPLCDDCHDAKSAAESLRAKKKGILLKNWAKIKPRGGGQNSPVSSGNRAPSR